MKYRFFSLLPALMIAGCALFDGGSRDSKYSGAGADGAPGSAPVVDVPSKGGRIDVALPVDPKSTTLSDIEILWQIPKEPVEGFLIRYGFDRQNIRHASRIYSRDLERYEDPKHGFVYRFVLGNVPLDKPIFITVAAFEGDRLSKPSDIFEVKAVSPS